MTSALSYQTDLIIKEKDEKILQLKKRVNNILSTYSPEYLKLSQEIDERMYYFLGETLDHWKYKLLGGIFDWDMFEKVKVIECFAFWNGYLKAGGILPPKVYDFPNSKYISCTNPKYGSFKSLEQKVIKGTTTFVVIPIGSSEGILAKIIENELITLSRMDEISQIYIGFDGIEIPSPLEKIINTNNKIISFQTKERSGPALLRNIGLEKGFSKGYTDAILIDSDIIIEPEILSKFILEFKSRGDVVGYPLIYSYGIGWFDQYHDTCGTLNGRYLDRKNKGQLLFGTTSCMMLNQVVLDLDIIFSNRFNTAAGEDINFCLDLLIQGVKIIPYDNIKIMHWYGYGKNFSVNLNILKRRFERYGSGEVNILKDHPNYYSLLEHTTERECIF